MVTGMNIGVEALDPVGNEFDRPPQQFRQRIRRHLIGIDMNLDAKGAADVPADDADLRLPQAQMQRRNVLHHVRRLGTLIDRQPRFGRAPVGHHRTRLQRHAGVPSENEFRFNDLVRFRQSLVDNAGIVIALEGEVVAERGMNHGRLRIERGAHVRDRVEFLIVDHDAFGGVFGRGTTARHYGGDGLALPAHTIDRDGALRGRFEALQMREDADPWRNDGR